MNGLLVLQYLMERQRIPIFESVSVALHCTSKVTDFRPHFGGNEPMSISVVYCENCKWFAAKAAVHSLRQISTVDI